MKTTTFFCTIFFFVTFLLIFISCDTVKNEYIKADSNPFYTYDSTDVVSIKDFHNWTQAWVNHGAGLSASKKPKSFTMPLIDLEEVVGEKPKASRFYLGLEITSTDTTTHLIVVGVDSLGNDMIDYGNGEYAYDVTCPCPDICPGGGGNTIDCTKN